jgi:hypothetical protein
MRRISAAPDAYALAAACTPTMIQTPASIGLLVVATLALAGCWTAPVASVQPKGEPRLIQDAIVVQSVKNSAIVRSVDATARGIVMFIPGDSAAATYRVGAGVRKLDRVRVGDRVRATITEELAVYVLRDRRVPVSGTVAKTVPTDARVLSVDQSYRLLTLQFPNGQTETFKVDRRVRLDEMGAGDEVVIRPVQVVSLRVRK